MLVGVEPSTCTDSVAISGLDSSKSNGEVSKTVALPRSSSSEADGKMLSGAAPLRRGGGNADCGIA